MLFINASIDFLYRFSLSVFGVLPKKVHFVATNSTAYILFTRMNHCDKKKLNKEFMGNLE